MKNKIKKALQSYPRIYDFFAIFSHLMIFLKFIVFKIFSLFLLPFKLQDRIVISNYKGKGFYDNPKYVVKVLKEKKSNLKVVWLVDEVNENIAIEKQYPNVTFVKNSFINKLKYLSTSKIWIDTSRKEYFPIKKNQTYIQFWHGGLGLKKIEGSLEKRKLIYKFTSLMDTWHTDIMISNSNHLTEIYRRDFNYKGPILQIGYPMNDVLFKDKDKKMSSEMKILYVPTFRGDEKESEIPDYFPDFPSLIDKLSQKGLNVKVIIRVHPSLNMDVSQIYNDPNILNGNNSLDIKQLVTESDLVISDYSSSIFDCVITKTPGIIYAKDYDSYSKERGLYYSLDELPFPYCFNDENLIDEILHFKQSVYEAKCETFIEAMGLVDDGLSSERFYLLLNDILANKTQDLQQTKWSKWLKK